MEFWHDRVLILDFGSQYTQLIARRIRESHVYSQILPCTTPLTTILAYRPKGIVLSGGPASVYDRKAPLVPTRLLELGIPILGICYGMQLVTHVLDGEVTKAGHREYGRAELVIDDATDLLKGVGSESSTTVWMSHGDRIERMPKGFRVDSAHVQFADSGHEGGRRRGAGSIVCSFIPKWRTPSTAHEFSRTSWTRSADASPPGP